MSSETPDILAKIDDLIKQATTERSHFYVASTLLEARWEIEQLRNTCAIREEQLAKFYKKVR